MFEPEELMARIVDLEEQLKVSEMAPPAAEQLIACLEGEIAKRDEELAACRVAVENCEVLRARIAELEDDLKCAHSMLAEVSKAGMALRAELAALKAQEPVAWAGAIEYGVPLLMVEPQNWKATPLYAAPVSEAKAQGVVMPEGWIPLTIEHEPGYPEDVAFGPKRMMDRLKKWLDRYFEMRLNATPVQQVSVPDEMRSLAQRLREYNQNPHHINPMSEAFHILVADAANALSTACVPKEIASAITWSEHLLFECGALTSTRAPSVHVYNKTFAAVNEARAMLAAAPAAPAANAGIVDMYRHLQTVTPYRFKKIQDASVTDGGDVLYFHKDRFDAALLADMAAHCAAKGVV